MLHKCNKLCNLHNRRNTLPNGGNLIISSTMQGLCLDNNNIEKVIVR